MRRGSRTRRILKWVGLAWHALVVGLWVATQFDWYLVYDLMTSGIMVFIWIPVVVLMAPLTAFLWLCDLGHSQGKCQTCGYDLTGNVTGICSECGTTVESQTWHDPEGPMSDDATFRATIDALKTAGMDVSIDADGVVTARDGDTGEVYVVLHPDVWAMVQAAERAGFQPGR